MMLIEERKIRIPSFFVRGSKILIFACFVVDEDKPYNIYLHGELPKNQASLCPVQREDIFHTAYSQCLVCENPV